MRYLQSYITVFSLIFAFGITSQLQAQVQSDYEIQQEFKEEYKSIEEGLADADEVDEADDLLERAEELESDFNEHEELLDRALYPETYADEIEKLVRHASTTQERVATLTEQEDRLNALSDEVSNYESDLDRMSNRADSLASQLQSTAQERTQLANTVERYRENIRDRDELILNMIDSLANAYGSVGDVSSIEGSEEARLNAENILGAVQAIANENIELLESNEALSTGDYLRMKANQAEFADSWEDLGNKIVEIYAEGEEEKEETDRLVEDWGEAVNSRAWTSLNQSFNENNINLPEFDDQDSFNNSLNSFLDDVIVASEESNSEEDYEEYERFANLWNQQVKAEWGNYLTGGEVLTVSQIAAVDQKLTQWGTSAEPESNLLLYLLGLSIIIIVVLAVFLARGKES